MSKLILKTLIVAKAEVTPGTDIVPTGANAILVRNPVLTPLVMTYAERALVRSFFGNFDSIPTIVAVRLTFEVEMQSSGTAGTAPAWNDLMAACGTLSTNVPATSQAYTPLSGTGKTVSIYYNVDGGLHKIVWARGTCKISIKANQIPVMAFTFDGIDTGLTDTALLTPTYTGFIAPVASNTVNTPTFTLLGTSGLALESFDLDFGNVVALIQRIGAQHVEHTDRKAVGAITMEMTPVATKDWLGAVKAPTLGALQIIHGVGAGKIIQIDCPNVQLKAPTFSNIQGLQMVSFTLNIEPTSAGNDDFTITAK